MIVFVRFLYSKATLYLFLLFPFCTPWKEIIVISCRIVSLFWKHPLCFIQITLPLSPWKIAAHRDNEGASLQEQTRQFLDPGSPLEAQWDALFALRGVDIYSHVHSQEHWVNWGSWENARDFENHTQVTWVGPWCHMILCRKSSASTPSLDCLGRGHAGLQHCPL